MLGVALGEARVTSFLVGTVNRDIAVFVERAHTKDRRVLVKPLGHDLRDQETTVVRRSIPESLRIDDDVVGVEEVSVVALEPLCSALLRNTTVSNAMHYHYRHRERLTPKTMPTLFLGSPMTTTVASEGPPALERSTLPRAGFKARPGMLRI